MGRTISVLAVLSLAAAACGGGGGRGAHIRTVDSALTRTDRQPHEFVYVEQTEQRTVTVRGRVQDDLRLQGTLSVAGVDILELILSDDAAAVRVIDQVAAAPYVEFARQTDEATGEALASGQWVVDFTAAPPFVPQPGRQGAFDVGGNPVLDAFYVFHYVERSIEKGSGIELFNAEAIDYNPRDDPWSADAEADLESDGIRRYTLQQPGLPRPSERGTRAALATSDHFRKMAFYLKGREAVEVREQVSIEDRPEFRRAQEGRAAQYFLELMEASLAGATQDPVREREMTYEVVRFDDGISVELPAENAFNGPVQPLLEPQALASVVPSGSPGAQPGGPVIPGLPAPGASEDAAPAEPGGEPAGAGGGDASADRAAQFSLRNALTAAKTIYTDGEDYRDATPERLQQAEPTLTFLQDGESTGPDVVSVVAISESEFRAAALSGSGTCFAIRDQATSGGGTSYASGSGTCTATSLAPGAYSQAPWGQGA